MMRNTQKAFQLGWSRRLMDVVELVSLGYELALTD